MSRYNYLLLTIAISLLVGCQKDKYVRDFTPQTNFEALWEILDTKYCYFEEKGIDWQGVKNVYEPRLKDVRNELSLFDLMAEMLDTLQDGHVNLYSPFDISRCRGWFEGDSVNFNNTLIYSQRYLGNDYRISGGFNYKTIASGTVGYVRYASFSDGFSAAGMEYIDKLFASCKGIIIDVRNNGGGSVDYSNRLAACFFKVRAHTGYICHKTGPGHSDMSAPQATYTDPIDAPIDWSDRRVVILTNRRSYSATNEFINQVKHAPNVTVIGGRTGGGGGMPLSSELPNGWMIRFSAVPTYNTNMEHIEDGIFPDILLNMSFSDERAGYDTLIEYAVSLF